MPSTWYHKKDNGQAKPCNNEYIVAYIIVCKERPNDMCVGETKIFAIKSMGTRLKIHGGLTGDSPVKSPKLPP